ncbi:MAG TPA: RDD family protein [Candidatus Elarobacter sp.]|jgi:uncharacterized RDD family membrane protein YckC
MQRSLDIRTGEAVEIRYELAGLGSRFLAVVVDGLAQIAVALALAFAFYAAQSAFGSRLHGANAGAWITALFVFAMFVVFIGWFIAFELWWSGRTPGKRALGLRVVRDGGFPIDAGAAVVRNLVRLVELGFGLYALSAISALISKENKRLGDFAAGTIVVRDRSEAPVDLDAYLARPARTDTGLREEDRVLIERFLARRDSLEYGARLRLAMQIAGRVRPTLVAAYKGLTDEELLEFLVRP